MAATHFSGPMVSANGFDGPTLTTQAAAGITGGTGTVYQSTCTKMGNVITTHIYIDLTGLSSKNTDLDIIGTGTDPAHLGRLLQADVGYLVSGSVTCIETPAGGDPNIAFYYADEATGAFDALISGLTSTICYDPNGDWAAGTVAAMANMPDNAVGEYLYAVQGDLTGTAAVYTAGIFLLEFIGIEA